METTELQSAEEIRQIKPHGSNSNLTNNIELPDVPSKVNRYAAFSVFINVISTILLILVGLTVYKTTGLYGGIDSYTGKIAVGAFISLIYVAVFRHAIYTK